MKKEKMVTRTVTMTKLALLRVDVENQSTYEDFIQLTGKFNDDYKLLKHIQKSYDTESVKTVSIISKSSSEVLYGMSEQEFVKNAVVLPARTKKGE